MEKYSGFGTFCDPGDINIEKKQSGKIKKKEKKEKLAAAQLKLISLCANRGLC